MRKRKPFNLADAGSTFMPSQPSTEEKKSLSKTHETTRLLLALWELGADKKAFKKGELPDRTKRPATVFNQLVEDGAIKGKIQRMTARKRISTTS